MDFLTEWFSGMHVVTKRALAFALIGILIFTVGLVSGTYSNINVGGDDILANIANNNAANNQPAQTTPNTTPTGSNGGDNTANPSNPADPGSTPSTGELSTPAEILAYYNESINKVKPNATSVVRNYQDIVHNAEYLEVPSLLKKAGESLIGQFVKGNFDPVTYSTKEEIIANFPVHDETYSSMATVDDIISAECNDDGTYYNITLVFATSVDPANGVGVGSAFNCMKTEEVMDAAGFVVKSFSVEYYDCKIECQIDKATGNTVKATFTCNEIMSVAAKGNLNAKVGLTFIDDYTINY